MAAAKSPMMGMLIAASLLLLGGTSHAGGIISAGSSGTLYFGGQGQFSYQSSRAYAGSSVVLGGTVPVALVARSIPDAAPVVASAPPAAVMMAASAPAAAVSAPAASAIAWTAPAYTPPVSVSLPPVSTPTPTTTYDAFINFGTAPYADAAMLTNGAPQSWVNSPSLVSAFGHTPSAAELNDFSQKVLDHVQSTFADSGLAIRATLDPTAQADHMLSVVSGVSATINPDAIGITRVGHNGFDFIDKLSYANSPDQLEWAVAHNVAHELMHAFGGEHHTTPEGNNLDAPMSDWSVLTNPATRFSAASVAEMTTNLRAGGLINKYGYGAELLIDGQELSAQPVPEPATMGLWGAAACLGMLIRHRRATSRRAA